MFNGISCCRRLGFDPEVSAVAALFKKIKINRWRD